MKSASLAAILTCLLAGLLAGLSACSTTPPKTDPAMTLRSGELVIHTKLDVATHMMRSVVYDRTGKTLYTQSARYATKGVLHWEDLVGKQTGKVDLPAAPTLKSMNDLALFNVTEHSRRASAYDGWGCDSPATPIT